MYRFRKGDHVKLHATVLGVHNDDSVGIQIEGYPHDIRIKTMHISMVGPHVEVGERVWNHQTETRGDVIAVNDDWIWVKTLLGKNEVWRGIDIDRIGDED